MRLIELKAQERERRKELILRAAQQLFSRRGLSQVNMRDIACKAGVSVGFIYRYFRGRSDIFVELFEAHAGAVFARMEADIGPGKPGMLCRLARTYIEFLLDNRMFFEMMSHFMLDGKLSPKALARVNESLRRLIEGVQKAFVNGRRGREARALAHAFFAALNGVLISFANYPGRTPRETRKRALMVAQTIATSFELETRA